MRAGYPAVRRNLRGPQACSAIARSARAKRYTAANGRSTARTPVRRRRANRHADRWCSSEHPVRRPGGARPLHVHRPRRAGSYATSQPARAQPPAQVDVLHVHEVALVPTADVVERAAAQEDRRARHPVDDARAGRDRRRAGGSASVKGFVGHHRPSRPWPTASGTDGTRRRRRVVGAVVVAHARTARGQRRLRVEAGDECDRGPGRDGEIGIQHRDDRRARRRDAEVRRHARNRRCPAACTTRRAGQRARQRLDRSVARAVVDDDQLDGTRAVDRRAPNARTSRAARPPRS